MKNKATPLISAVLSLFSLGLFAQQTQINRAQAKYDRYEYIDAIKIYERVCSKGFQSPEMLEKLANAYYFNGDLQTANKWYTALFELTSDAAPEYYYRYAQSLKSVGDFKAADLMMQTFSQKVSKDRRAVLFADNKDYLKQIEKNSGRFNLNHLSLNSKYSDYGTAVYNDVVVFASARDTGGVSKKIHQWTGESFTQLYQASLDEEGNFTNVKSFSSALNSKFNESTPVFSKDGNTVYFTRNNFLNGKRQFDANKNTLLKIYRAEKIDQRWTNVTELPFNSNDFSTAHPALSPDGHWLYFASDREGGLGQSDLYRVAILKNGSFGLPVPLGDGINTPGRESFPFLSDDGELYFSTDGRPGLGGLDIYVSKINADGNFTEPVNIGAPVNGPSDDFAYVINATTRTGFFSSNRTSGWGKDDIYSFVENRKLECVQRIEGFVFDVKDPAIKLANAQVVLYNQDHELLQEGQTDADGKYSFDRVLECNSRVYLKAAKEKYLEDEKHLDLPALSSTQQLDLALSKKQLPVKKGDDLTKVLKLEIIYFDLDKSNIRPDAAIELAKVVEVMREHPNMKIDVRSHTDSRGKDAYNLQLSDRRAKSTVAWIVNQGIDKQRITGKGYGETQLINSCSNGVKCSEEAHQENRRSEFIVVEL